MFCHNCGSKVPDNSNFCENCGTALQNNNVFSPAPVTPKPNPFAEQRTNPFAEQGTDPFAEPGAGEPSTVNSNVAGLLSLFFGLLGLHDFYAGKTTNGIIKLILSVTGIATIVAAIWNVIDLYNIGDGSYVDGQGRYLEPAPWAKILVIMEILLVIGVIALVVALLSSLF